MDKLKKAIEIKEKYLKKIIKYFPGFITPNLLTALRLLLLPLIIILIIYGYSFFALLVFVFAFSLDLFDGPLARLRNQATDFGALFDPFVDKTVFLTVMFLVAYQSLPRAMLFTILALEIIVVIVAGILAPIAKKIGYQYKIGANKYGKYKMFFQFIGIAILMISPANQSLILAGTIIFTIAILFSALSIVDHCFNIKK